MTSCNIHVWNYLKLVEGGTVPMCTEQKQLALMVEKIIQEEDIYFDGKQIEEYLSYEKYFPFKLLTWEKFCFVMHNCCYTSDGFPRFPILFIYVGRGAGKNGYLGFEDFCLLTPTNPVKNYHIYIYAMSEDQAKRSWEDVYNILEENKTKMQRFFSWNKEVIRNKQTNSEFYYKANNPKTADSFRPGKVDHDEAHGYENPQHVTTPTTGLGKVAQPRRTITTTDGKVRGGYLDQELKKMHRILSGEIADGGVLPFICRLDNDDEIHNPDMWEKANPSLRYMPTLKRLMLSEYQDYVENPILYADFATKRMNRPPQAAEGQIVDYKYIEATSQPINEEEIHGKPCVAGVDYMKTNDFLGAGLLYRVNGRDIWISHTWVCRQSADLGRIKAPLDAWEAAGMLTYVDAPEIAPELPAVWLVTEAARRGSSIVKFGIDYYRYTLLKKALLAVNLTAEKGGKIKLIRPQDEMLIVPIITSKFINQLLVWGDSPPMRWMANNSKLITSAAGNITYGKIEPKSRKTDTFKSFVMAEAVSDILDQTVDVKPEMYDVAIFD